MKVGEYLFYQYKVISKYKGIEVPLREDIREYSLIRKPRIDYLTDMVLSWF